MNNHIETLQATVDQLRREAPVRIGDVIVDPLYSQCKHQGIYEIRDATDSQVVYVGKTTIAKDGLAQRIWDHANGISGLMETLEVSREKFRDFKVRLLAVPDLRLRGLVEYYAIAILNPPGNLVG